MKVMLPMALVLLAASAARAKEVTVEVNGHRVHLVVSEPARRNPALPTIVFESGLGDAGTQGWRRVIPLLAHDVRVVRYDRPGLGASDPDGDAPTPRHGATVLRDALAKAGWTVVRTFASSDALVVAHYAKDGRDLFSYLAEGGGHGTSFSVADVGAVNEAKKLADALAKEGHVAI